MAAAPITASGPLRPARSGRMQAALGRRDPSPAVIPSVRGGGPSHPFHRERAPPAHAASRCASWGLPRQACSPTRPEAKVARRSVRTRRRGLHPSISLAREILARTRRCVARHPPCPVPMYADERRRAQHQREPELPCRAVICESMLWASFQSRRASAETARFQAAGHCRALACGFGLAWSDLAPLISTR